VIDHPLGRITSGGIGRTLTSGGSVNGPLGLTVTPGGTQVAKLLLDSSGSPPGAGALFAWCSIRRTVSTSSTTPPTLSTCCT